MQAQTHGHAKLIDEILFVLAAVTTPLVRFIFVHRRVWNDLQLICGNLADLVSGPRPRHRQIINSLKSLRDQYWSAFMPPRTHQTWKVMVLKAWSTLPVSKNTIHALLGLPAIVVADQYASI